MTFDVAQIDRLLTTTRAVRKKLDFDRDVTDELLLRLIDVAEQAPSGSNQASRRWLIVRHPATRKELAEIYRAGATGLEALARTEAATPTTAQKVFGSAAFLAGNLERAPALVILGIWGVHDGSGRPSLFDSSIQAGWSFCLAARARGLGTAWTTLHLQRREEVAALLAIPDGFTQVVLFPVAYTTQDDFRPVERRPAREITYFDEWGFTDRNIPLQERRNPLEGRGVCVSIDVAASTERVWELVTDINTPGRHCKEAAGATWDEGDTPGLGASFKGRNATDDTGHPTLNALILERRGKLEWETPCTVTAWEPGRRFEYGVGEPDNPWASWGFSLQPLLGGGVRLEHYLVHGPALSGTARAAAANPAEADDIVLGRFRCVRENLTHVLAGVKAEAEN
ncbi:MAG TPA: nitroreductase family protein [Acidimicrobiia bacterium]